MAEAIILLAALVCLAVLMEADGLVAAVAEMVVLYLADLVIVEEREVRCLM